MSRLHVGLLLAAVVVVTPPPASAQEPTTSGQHAVRTLTLNSARALARRGPAAVLGTARVASERAKRVDADRVLRQNPTLEAGVGPRFATSSASIDVDVGIAQPIELGGGRSDRLAAVEASTRGAAAERDDLLRNVDREVGVAFVLGLWAKARGAIAERAARDAVQLDEAVGQRVAKGEATGIDRVVVSTARARANAEFTELTAEEDAARRQIKSLLGLEDGEAIALAGDLRAIATPVQRAPDGSMRPDVRRAVAERDAARAEAEVAHALAWPTLSIGARYAREDASTDILMGTLAVSLPFFDAGSGARAEAAARIAEADAEIAVRTTTARGETSVAEARWKGRLASAVALDQLDDATLEAAVAGARKRYEGGQDQLADVVATAREVRAFQAERLDLWRDAAIAAIELEAARGARGAR